MYTSVKIKSKNLHGLSARTIVYYNDENHILTIQVVMIIPNDNDLEGYEIVRQLTNHKIVTSWLNFKLSTAIEVEYALSSIFTTIMRKDNLTNIEFTKYANNISYETQSNNSK